MNESITNSIVSSFRSWDEVGDGDIILYDCILAVDTNEFKKGDEVPNITFLFSKSICEIWNAEGTEVLDTFKLKLIPVFE